MGLTAEHPDSGTHRRAGQELIMAKIKKIFESHQRLILGVSGIALFFIAWEIIGQRTNRIILPPFSAVLTAGYDMFATGMIWPHLELTLSEFLLGFAIAIALGIPIGMLMGWVKKINFTVDPLLSMIYAVPFVAIIPLIILWFGIGTASKIVTVIYVSIFPLILNTMAGVKRADESLLKVGQSFGASSWKMFSAIVIPGAFPYILSGLRLSLGRALVGAIAAEQLAAIAGLGWLTARYEGTFQMDKMLAVILVIAVIGVVSVELLKKLEARFEGWRIR